MSDGNVIYGPHDGKYEQHGVGLGYFSDVELLSTAMDQSFTQPFDCRWGDLFSIQYLFEGSMRYGRDRGPLYRLDAPAIYWVDPRHSYQLGGMDANDGRHLVIFRGDRGRRLIEEGFDVLGENGFIMPAESGLADRIFRQLASLDEADRSSSCEVCLLLEELLGQLSRRPERRSGKSPRLAEIREVARLIQSDPMRPWDLRDEASRLHMSYSHFRRLFSRYVGRAPYDHLLRSRMQYAGELLTQSNRQTKEVAYLLGYDDPAQFSKSFKKQLGMSPAQFRMLRG